MTKSHVEVITSVQRRRRWSRAEKERIVAAAMEPGAVASEVARAAGIHTSQLFRWRQQLCERAQVPAAFTPVAITPAPEATALAPTGNSSSVAEHAFFLMLTLAKRRAKLDVLVRSLAG
jgi:transposase